MEYWTIARPIRSLFQILTLWNTCLFLLGYLMVEGKRRSVDSDYQYISDEERLYNHLFRRYNKAIRPVLKFTHTVDVNLTFSLKQIHSLDEKVQVFKTYGWLIVKWRDERLSWKPENFDNMTEFVIASSLMWTPELALINAVEVQFPNFSQYGAVLTHDGAVRWEPAGVFETSCKIDISFYPYDTQACSLVFGTWTFTSFKVNLTSSLPVVILDDYNTSGEWHITGTHVERQEFIYECCPEFRFSKVAATISLKRRHRFYTMNLILPCAMLSSLTLVTFLSPPDQGEKISLGISILLSFSVFMLSLSENMPKTSETLPLFGIFSTFVMFMNTLSVMLTVLVLNLHHRAPSKPVPGWVKTLFFQVVGRLLCMHSTEDWEPGIPCSGVKHELAPAPPSNTHAREKNVEHDGYNVNYAAAQFSGKIRNTDKYSPPATNHSNSPEENNSFHESAKNGKQPKEYRFYREFNDWKKLARIIDRLFFWMTLLALISVGVGVVCVMWT